MTRPTRYAAINMWVGGREQGIVYIHLGTLRLMVRSGETYRDRQELTVDKVRSDNSSIAKFRHIIAQINVHMDGSGVAGR